MDDWGDEEEISQEDFEQMILLASLSLEIDRIVQEEQDRPGQGER